MSRVATILFTATFALAGSAAACGGRSPLGSLAYEQPGEGGTSTTNGGYGGMAGSGAVGAAGFGGDGATGAGASGNGGYGPLDCMTCIGESCPQMLECLLDPACLQGLGCSVMNCMGGGGGPDLECVADCFGGDMGAAMTALAGIMCITQTCAEPCQGLLPMPPGPPGG